jgi:iron-sulfur cluster repair protein YtfE (RIC family)
MMETTEVTSYEAPPRSGAMPELQIPMISTLVSCLASEHRRLDEHVLQLALAANRLATHPDELRAKARASEAWDEIRRELWSHLQIEDALVFSWGTVHQAISKSLLDSVKAEREEMRRLLASMPDVPSGETGTPPALVDYGTFARTLTALAQNLDSHVERYDVEILPAILRGIFVTTKIS